MLLLIAALIMGILMYNRTSRLEGSSDSGTSVRAWVDGKRVDSYVKED